MFQYPLGRNNNLCCILTIGVKDNWVDNIRYQSQITKIANSDSVFPSNRRQDIDTPEVRRKTARKTNENQ